MRPFYIAGGETVQTQVYISVSDAWKSLVVDGNLELLNQLLLTLYKGQDTRCYGPLSDRDSDTRNAPQKKINQEMQHD